MGVWFAYRNAHTASQFFDAFVAMIPVSLLAGIFFGLLFGAVMATLLKGTTNVIPIRDKATFVPNVTTALKKVGYERESQDGNTLIFRPTLKAGVLSSRVSVELADDAATITGPLMHLKKMERFLSKLET